MTVIRRVLIKKMLSEALVRREKRVFSGFRKKRGAKRRYEVRTTSTADTVSMAV